MERTRELREEQTTAEEVLWELLRNRQFLGLKFRRQHQIGDFITDFFCDEHKLVVEADGEVHETPEKREHDAKRDAILRGQGFQIVRLRNETVLEEPARALEGIASKAPARASP